MGSVGMPNHWHAGVSVSLILFDLVIQFRAVPSIGLYVHFMPYVPTCSNGRAWEVPSVGTRMVVPVAFVVGELLRELLLLAHARPLRCDDDDSR